MIVEPSHDSDLSSISQAQLAEWFRTYRTLFFRGWDLELSQFRALSDQQCDEFSQYEGGGFRYKMLNRESVNNDSTVMTTTGHSQGFEIPLHGEMHYMGRPPQVIWFYCQTPPHNTGQTTLCDGIALAAQLPEAVKDYFRGRKIQYMRFLADGDWQTTFMTEDPLEAQKLCASQGLKYTYDADARTFQTNYTVSPILNHGPNGEPCFINNFLNVFATEWAFESGWIQSMISKELGVDSPMVVRLDDGSRIPGWVYEQIRDTAEKLTLNIEWKRGEVVMADNWSVLHGRRESKDSNREVFVRMGRHRASLLDTISPSLSRI